MDDPHQANGADGGREQQADHGLHDLFHFNLDLGRHKGEAIHQHAFGK